MQLLIQHFRHKITHRWSRPRSFMGTPQSTAGRCTMRAELPSMAFWCCLTQRSLGSHPKITCLGIVSIPKSSTWAAAPKTRPPQDRHLSRKDQTQLLAIPQHFPHVNEKTVVPKRDTQWRGDSKTSLMSLNNGILGEVGTYHLGLAPGVRLPWAPGGFRGGGCHRRGAGPIPGAGGCVTGVEGQHVTLGDILQ